MSSSVLSVRINAKDKDRLAALAARTGRKESFYVRQALQEHLQDLEDYYLGLEALEQYRRDGVSYSLEQVANECGVEL